MALTDEIKKYRTLLETRDPLDPGTIPLDFGNAGASPVPAEPMPAQNKQQLIHTLDTIMNNIEQILASPDRDFVEHARKKIALKLRRKK